MSLTYLSTTIGNPHNGASISHRMLVDSGATFSIAPSSVLKKLHISPLDTQKFILANGQEVDKEIGEAKFTVMGKQRTAPVVFGDNGVWVIGATTLESMGYALDPLHRRLLDLPLNV